MAAAPEIQTVTITLNGVELAVPKGELIVESAKRLGVEIPIFCYHDRMKPVGMCRMCLVEAGSKGPDGTVRMMPKPQASCTLPSSEGLIINTDTPKIHGDRRSVLEMLLVNHPLDCPICDRGGECPLQNNTLFYGPSTSRFVELKRHAPKAFPLSKHVVLDLERCIQCGRCVRFTEEISGDGQLAFRFRGAEMQPSTFELTDFDSKFSGNVIEICPVGALTSAHYRFRARPWDLETKPAICLGCSNGCNVWMDYRVGKVVRINGRVNEAVNEEWTCDRGKFGHDFYNADSRLASVLVRRNDRLEATDWPDAFRLIAEAFSGGEVAALAGKHNSNEDLYGLREVLTETFGSNNLDYRMTRDLSTRPSKRVSTSIEALEHAPVIVVFGTSLADDLPIVYLRVRKAWVKHGARVVVASSKPTDVDSFAHLVLRYGPGSEAQAVKALGGDAAAAKAAGFSAEAAAEAASLARGATIVTAETIYDVPGASALVDGLIALGEFNLFATGGNDQGAHELGILPGSGGRDTKAILEGCARGEIKALWLAGVDPLTDYPDRDLALRALESVPFLVYQGHSRTEAAHYATVVLPQTAPAETDGTYTNCEGRVQRMRPVLAPPGQAKPGWKIFGELAIRIKPAAPPFHASDVMDRIASCVPAFEHAHYTQLPETGHVLHGPPALDPIGLEA
ncbi:MAG: NADH-quinone oxidoreductase subunit NuoG [Fimbriimonadaceae bacterium]